MGQGLKMEKKIEQLIQLLTCDSECCPEYILSLLQDACISLNLNSYIISGFDQYALAGVTRPKNPRVAYHFQPMYVPHIMGYDHPMPSLPTKVSGLRRGRVAKGGNFLLFEVVLPLMG